MTAQLHSLVIILSGILCLRTFPNSSLLLHSTDRVCDGLLLLLVAEGETGRAELKHLEHGRTTLQTR